MLIVSDGATMQTKSQWLITYCDNGYAYCIASVTNNNG